jgi:hypothetical protein
MYYLIAHLYKNNPIFIILNARYFVIELYRLVIILTSSQQWKLRILLRYSNNLTKELYHLPIKMKDHERWYMNNSLKNLPYYLRKFSWQINQLKISMTHPQKGYKILKSKHYVRKMAVFTKYSILKAIQDTSSKDSSMQKDIPLS